MAYVPVENTVEVEMRYLLDDEPAENTLYFHKPAGWIASTMITLGASLKDWWETFMQPAQSVHAQLREIYITDLTSPTATAISYTTGLPLPGALAGEAMPNNIAPCISFRTAQRGRSYRGRNYLLGLNIDQVSGNNIVGAYQTAILAAYSELITLAGDATATWCVVSRYSGVVVVDGKRKPVPRETGISTPINSVLFVDTTVDSQRGRLPNH